MRCRWIRYSKKTSKACLHENVQWTGLGERNPNCVASRVREQSDTLEGASDVVEGAFLQGNDARSEPVERLTRKRLRQHGDNRAAVDNATEVVLQRLQAVDIEVQSLWKSFLG